MQFVFPSTFAGRRSAKKICAEKKFRLLSQPPNGKLFHGNKESFTAESGQFTRADALRRA
ncbi:MAG: hypothetical protein DBX55_09915 [Verrucomicrobia bacterium]|nr:MAG: hypothetical protein DBX55_09915 [Verrucomicrobiota bacterium]